MQTEIIIAGFGGQGVLFGGTLLAEAAVEENKHTTWFPSYGAEMRGGTANSTVIVSDEEIGSPVIVNPAALISLNRQSLEKFLPRVKPGGLVVVNASLVPDEITRDGVTIVRVPATAIADKELGDLRTANLVMVGAMLGKSGLLKLASAQKACERVLAEKPKLIPLNQKALELGFRHTGKKS
jgi:2-oxoglutarate ferredoxin oxidoreductase subunit gamma